MNVDALCRKQIRIQKKLFNLRKSKIFSRAWGRSLRVTYCVSKLCSIYLFRAYTHFSLFFFFYFSHDSSNIAVSTFENRIEVSIRKSVVKGHRSVKDWWCHEESCNWNPQWGKGRSKLSQNEANCELRKFNWTKMPDSRFKTIHTP